jgi:hypothetical protein
MDLFQQILEGGGGGGYVIREREGQVIKAGAGRCHHLLVHFAMFTMLTYI